MDRPQADAGRGDLYVGRRVGGLGKVCGLGAGFLPQRQGTVVACLGAAGGTGNAQADVRRGLRGELCARLEMANPHKDNGIIKIIKPPDYD